jgi:hypothetical protein
MAYYKPKSNLSTWLHWNCAVWFSRAVDGIITNTFHGTSYIIYYQAGAEDWNLPRWMPSHFLAKGFYGKKSKTPREISKVSRELYAPWSATELGWGVGVESHIKL